MHWARSNNDQKRDVAAVLKVENLKVYGLAPLSFEVQAGQCLAVLGPSGSGKSILLRAIADLDPAEGNVVLDGVERNAISPMAWRCKVRYFAAEPGWWAPTPRPHFADADQLTSMLETLGLEPSKLDQQIISLSTGERQRLAIIRGLESKPQVLLFDEPTSALDTVSAARVEAMIKDAIERGAHVVLVSHDDALAERLADHHITLRGRADQAGAKRLSPVSGAVP